MTAETEEQHRARLAERDARAAEERNRRFAAAEARKDAARAPIAAAQADVDAARAAILAHDAQHGRRELVEAWRAAHARLQEARTALYPVGSSPYPWKPR